MTPFFSVVLTVLVRAELKKFTSMTFTSLGFDEQTVTAIDENEYRKISIRADTGTKPNSKSLEEEHELALAKLRSLQEDFKDEFDDMIKLSHMSFAEKHSVCYEALLYEKGHEVTKQIVRVCRSTTNFFVFHPIFGTSLLGVSKKCQVTHEGFKTDTCTLNKTIRHEQRKSREHRDERSLLYFPTLSSVDVEHPVLVTVEERIVGQELLDVIHACRYPFGPQRLGYMANLFIQMCHGIAFLHEHGYTHNDLAFVPLSFSLVLLPVSKILRVRSDRITF